MGFSLSASVNVKELDLTTTVPAVATSIGAMVGDFAWGPVEQVTLVDSENNLVKYFGLPNEANFVDWFSASNFLSYANNLKLVRAVGAAAVNSGDVAGILVKNLDDYELSGTTIDGSLNTFVGKYPGTFGNGITVELLDSTNFTGHTHEPDFDYAPTGQEVFVVVLLDGDIVEKFTASLDVAAKDYNGNNNYIEELVNRTSQYVYIVMANLALVIPADYSYVLASGVDDSPIAADRMIGYDLFSNSDDIDISLVMQAGGDTLVGTYIKDNVADSRRDCVAFLSPAKADVVGNAFPVDATLLTRDSYGSSSYCVMDSNYKYQYDKYNDKYRWLPLNADIAGLCARTDDVADPWFSPGGPNRGQIKNTIKLAYNPSKAQRDDLYKNAINPVVTFPGEGTLLYGDKTLQTKPSAFDRINVRRLFIVLEKAIATFAKYSLFEFNDVFTRNRFTSAVEPFLRNVQGRRGVVDFRVIANETNNTGEVIDRNEFVADIYIKPNRSINFIYLNFVAIKSGVTFEEIIG